MIVIRNRIILGVLNRMLTVLSKNQWGRKIFSPLIKWKKCNGQMYIIDDSFIEYVQKKKAGLEKHASDIEVIGIRGSYVDYGFYAQDITKFYNLGLTSTDLYVTYWMYVNDLRKLPRLKSIVLYYSVFAPGLSLIRTNEKYRQVVYDYFFNIPIQKEASLNENLVSHIKKKCREFVGNEVDENYWGYEKKTFFLSIEAEKRVVTHLRENNREPDQMEWLMKLSQKLDEDGRNLYIVITPFRSDYKRELPECSVLFHKLYDLQLAPNTRILNYFYSPLFDDSDFGDTDHLNEKGAMKITDEIRKEIFADTKGG